MRKTVKHNGTVCLCGKVGNAGDSLVEHPKVTYLDLSMWDYAAEVSIDVSIGELVIAGRSDYSQETARIFVENGDHQAWVPYSNSNLDKHLR